MVDVYMKRSAKIYMVLLVWIAAALQFFINEKMDIEEVFASMQEADTQLEVHADISVWGVYEMADSEKSENKDSKDVCPCLTPAKINNLLLNTAGCFGVSAGELTVTGRHDSITTFQSNGDPAFWRFTFIDNSVTGQGYLVVQTDRIEAVDQIHTFFDNLNIKEMVSVEADIYADSLTQEQVMTAAVASYGLTSDTVVVSREQTERSHTGRILEQILQELPVTGLTQTPDGWYGRLNSSVHLSNLTANKNVRIQETDYGSVHLQFGDKTDLVRLYASVLRR